MAAFFPEFAAELGVSRGAQEAQADSAAQQTTVASPPEATESAIHPTVRIPVNISELSDRFEVQASLPGFTFEQVEVTFEDNVLTLQARTGTPTSSEQRNMLRQEIPVGSYARSVAFREAINPEAVSATMQAGLLTVTLGKQTQPQPRRIAIKNPSSN